MDFIHPPALGYGYNACMFLGALLIGLLTAYYFGIKPGIIAAGASALLFIVAQVVPGAMLGVYGLVALFIIGVIVIGPRRAQNQPSSGAQRVRRLARQALGRLWKLL